jgi:hypothetical protein
MASERWRRKTGVIHTPRKTNSAYIPDTVNDGGKDAPLTSRDSRFVALSLLCIVVVGVVIAFVWTLLA